MSVYVSKITNRIQARSSVSFFGSNTTLKWKRIFFNCHTIEQYIIIIVGYSVNNIKVLIQGP